MDFVKYNNHINRAGNLTEVGGAYEINKVKCLKKQEEAKTFLTTADSTLKAITETSDVEEVKQALRRSQEKIKEYEKTVFEVNAIATDTKKLHNDSLNNLRPFEADFIKTAKEFNNIKGEILIATEILRKALFKSELGFRAADQFLKKFKSLYLETMTDDLKSEITAIFKDMVTARWSFFNSNKDKANIVRQDLGEKESEHL